MTSHSSLLAPIWGLLALGKYVGHQTYDSNAGDRLVKKQVLIISAFHDYRTDKRASIHKVADGLVQAGYDVDFVSTRFSHLSKRTGDSRLFLWKKANQVEVVRGVRCLLWRTTLHPFRSRQRWLERVNDLFFRLYAELPNRQFDEMATAADYVIVESGLASIYLRRLRRLNPQARIIYYAADRLATVGAHPFIARRLLEDQDAIDHFSLRSEQMKEDFDWASGPLTLVGFGIDKAEYANVGASPYKPGQQVAVSVGSMLFDPTVFQLAAASFPEVEFHVIGCGTEFDAPSNVHIHPEMPFRDTLPYVKHATVGIAAYQAAESADYLADSSLKLAQFESFGLPAICPRFAQGTSPNRIGYEPGDAASIRTALREALASSGRVPGREFPSWKEVALQVLEPEPEPEPAFA